MNRSSDRRITMTVLCIGVVLSAPGAVIRADPSPDGLFYESHVLRLGGASRAAALDAVFSSDRARRAATKYDEPLGQVRIRDPEWVSYAADFYERRWLVPAIAFVIHEVGRVGPGRALQLASMLAYALLGVALYGLLRRRFCKAASAVVAVGCLLWPPLYRWSTGPYVDSWSLLLQTAGLLLLLMTADRGFRWLPLWALAVLALSLTRDATIALIAAAAALLWSQRRGGTSRGRAVALLITGAAAAVPVLLVAGAPLRASLAYVIDGYNIPEDDSWRYVTAHLGAQLLSTVEQSFTYPLDHAPPGLLLYPVLAIGAGLVAVVAFGRRRRKDPLVVAGRGVLVGGAIMFLLALNAQGYRYELVFLPVMAVGAAALIEDALISGHRPATETTKPRR